MDNTGYLYHYTNLETLALILKNRTIRFNSLDKMDDLQEQETADIKNIGKFCYISSWTDDSSESIPMWNMYSSLNQGVRIRLPRIPFKTYENNAENLSLALSTPVEDQSNGRSISSLIPWSEFLINKYIILPTTAEHLLHQVEYTNDTNKLYPNLLTENGDHFTIATGQLGKYKNLHWSFQKEWRYILTILPFNIRDVSNAGMSNFQITANKIRQGVEPQPLPYYDMHLSDEAFDSMQITLSPKMSAGNHVIAENLVEKFNPSAELCNSSLLGLI